MKSFIICRRWKSYTAPEKTVLMTNVQDSVFQLFQRVENKHGWMLVSHALAYVTAVRKWRIINNLNISLPTKYSPEQYCRNVNKVIILRWHLPSLCTSHFSFMLIG